MTKDGKSKYGPCKKGECISLPNKEAQLLVNHGRAKPVGKEEATI